MKIVFFGTPDYVLEILATLHKKFGSKKGESPIAAVVTQQPRPAGRNQILTYSPIDNWAHKRKIPVFYKSIDLISSGIKADMGVLAAFGEIVPKGVINFFPHGILNIHPSLLPRWKGASPIQSAILSGDTKTGVTIIKLDELVDHGAVVTRFEEEILDNDTAETLRARLFARSAQVLASLITPYIEGKITLKPQGGKEETLTFQIKKGHGFIPGELLVDALKGKKTKNKLEIPFIKDFAIKADAKFLERFIRAMQPWPGAWTKVRFGKGWNFAEKRVKILKARLDKNVLVLEEVQLEGKNPVSWEEFERGYPTATLTGT